MIERSRTSWWGDHELDEGVVAQWRVGPLRLWAERTSREWRLRLAREDDPDSSEASVSIPAAEPPDAFDVEEHRFGFETMSGRIRVMPRLANRATVVYPESAFHVTPGQGIRLFCCTPLWVAVEVGDEGLPLLDVPSLLPPETWFGASTVEGELCYAARTAARLRRSELPVHAHRATTELRIVNRGTDLLHLERINISVPLLSLYSAQDGRLYTDAVTLTRSAEDSLGELALSPPPSDLDLEHVSGPRETSQAVNVVVRAFSAIFD